MNHAERVAINNFSKQNSALAERFISRIRATQEDIDDEENIHDEVNDIALEISYDVETQQVVVLERASGKALPAVNVYWFAWQAFYPDTQLW